MADTVPANSLPLKASTLMLTRWPTRSRSTCVSLKLATTHFDVPLMMVVDFRHAIDIGRLAQILALGHEHALCLGYLKHGIVVLFL